MSSDQSLGNLGLTPTSLAPVLQGLCLRPSKVLITNAQIDSRLCQAGSVFFAIRGSSVDGAAFIQDAQSRGAAAVVVPRHQGPMALATVNCAVIAVDDALSALHMLARFYIKEHRHVTLIGITGSVGKTTTKEALATILSYSGPTAKTPGNLNSEYGLPLSIFTLALGDRYGVFELGIDHVGEMERLVSTLTPSYALLTNVGISHLERFGSTAVTAHEKARIFHPTIEAGFVSAHCSHLSLIQKRSPTVLQQYSLADIKAIDLGLEGWRLTWKGQTFTIRAVGRHLLEDVVGAITVADRLGLDAPSIARSLEGFGSMPGRTSVQSGAITIIDDTYNASWDSTSTIVSYLSRLMWQGGKKVVLGPMKELGSASESAHRKVAGLLARSSFTGAHLYGPEMEVAKDELKRLGFGGEVTWTEDFDILGQQVKRTVEKGDLVLLKASRSVAIDRLIPSLSQQWGAYA